MAKFQVKIMEVHAQIIDVEAGSAEQARETAQLILESGIQQDGSDLPDATEYDRTIDSSEWKVWEV